MQLADIEARKFAALGKTLRKWLEVEQEMYDPDLVGDLFGRYLTSRRRLMDSMPEVFGDLPYRLMVTETLAEGKKVVPRVLLEALDNDLEYGLTLLLAYASTDSQPSRDTSTTIQDTVTDPSQVFVIHGRNENIRKAMFEFLRAIGLKPMEWLSLIHSTGNPSPYIGDVLNQAFSKAQAVIALLTPDDLAKLNPAFLASHDMEYERKLTGQARPNVLFETGMALGRAPNRTVIVTVGENRPFSDIAGIHTVRLTNSVASRQSLATRLRACGCPVTTETQTDWHSAGDFNVAPLFRPIDVLREIVKESVAAIPVEKSPIVSKQRVIEQAVQAGVDYALALEAFDVLTQEGSLVETTMAGNMEYLVYLGEPKRV